MFDRVLTPIIAIGLAFLVWMYTRSRDEEVLDNYHVPVELAIAPGQAGDYELETDGTTSVPVSFMGPPSRIRELRGLLQHGAVTLKRTVAVPEENLAEANYPDVIRLDSLGLSIPPGVRAVIAESQGRVRITLRKLIEKPMKVRFRHTGDNRVDSVVCEPSTVLVRGPKEVLERDDYVDTQLYHVSKSNGLAEAMVVDARAGLVSEVDHRRIQVTPREVTVRFTLLPSQRTYEVEAPIHFLCPLGFAFRPKFTSDREGRIVLRIQGPATEQRPVVKAYVDLTTRRFGAGLHAAEPIHVELPPGFTLAQEPPRLSSFQLQPVDVDR